MNVFCCYSKNNPRDLDVAVEDVLRVKHLQEWRFLWKEVATCERMVYNILTNHGLEITSVERI